MKLSLVVLTEGKTQGQAIDVKLAQFVIGRDPQCHLRPASPMISKRHCALIQRDGKAFIHDFDSTNGTLLNEQPIKGEAALANGDKLKIGPILFEVRLTAPAAEKVPAKTLKAPAAPTVTEKAPAKAAVKPAPVGAAKAAPAAKAKAAAERAPEDTLLGGSSDDDAAAMLLSMQDDDAPSALSAAGTADLRVPDGSTIHEMQIPDAIKDAEGGDKGKGDKHSQVKAQQANTSSAAKSILDKYLKRPR